MVGGTPWRSGASTILKSSVIWYASDRSANKSLVVFTGANRSRGMTTAVAPSKQEIAAPIAVSSCRTGKDFLSRGSTVLEFFMTGSGMAPSCFSKMALSASRSTHRLFVLKNLYLDVSWKAFSSSSGHWADSRSSKRPVFASFAKCPPFLSASVRVATSIMKGAFVEAKYVNNFKSIVAPRLSELDTNMYLNPLLNNLSKVPLPNMAGYRSPCPGGHHSWPGSFSHFAGVKSDAVTFGALFCTNSRSLPEPNSGYLANASKVSFEVEKEFINMKARSTLYWLFIEATCLAMRSRNVKSSVTFNITVVFSKDGSGVTSMPSMVGSESTG